MKTMTAKDLKNALLQEAVQGRLVTQCAADGNARTLLDAIRAEKQKSAKSKFSKPLPPIDDDEIPFDIPESWEWVRLGEIAEIKSSKRVFEKEYVSEGIPFFRSKEIGDLSRGESIHTELFITRDHYNELKKNYGVPQINDILLTSVGSIGNYWICDGREFYYKDGNVTQICNSSFFDSKFIALFLASPLFFEQVNTSVSGTAYNALTIIKLKSLLIPLPPLAEQRRIVSAIEKLLPLIDEYGKNELVINALNSTIGQTAKKAILQEAVQGRLVPQCAADGNARELLDAIRAEKQKSAKSKSSKPLPPISDDEIPFDIPDSWVWVRLGEIAIIRDSERIPLSVAEREKLQKMYDYYGASGVIDKVDKYLFDKPLLLIGEDGANLLSRSTPIAFIAEGKYWVNNHAHVLDFNENYIFMKYIMYYINAISLAKYVTGTAQPKMNQEKMNSIPIPLPPLAEQRRIVSAIEKLLPMCERLGKE